MITCLGISIGLTHNMITGGCYPGDARHCDVEAGGLIVDILNRFLYSVNAVRNLSI